MTLSIYDIYTRYSVRKFCRLVEIKRLNADGLTHETDWQDVETLSGLKLLEDTVGTISHRIASEMFLMYSSH